MFGPWPFWNEVCESPGPNTWIVHFSEPTFFQALHIATSQCDPDPVDLCLLIWGATLFLQVRLWTGNRKICLVTNIWKQNSDAVKSSKVQFANVWQSTGQRFKSDRQRLEDVVRSKVNKRMWFALYFSRESFVINGKQSCNNFDQNNHCLLEVNTSSNVQLTILKSGRLIR